MKLKNNRDLFSKKVLAGAVIVAGLLLLYFVLLLNGITYSTRVVTTPKANLTVIAAGIIPTPDLGLLTMTPTATIPSSEVVDGISSQKFVKIQGTGGAGLRIRSEPGTKSEVIFLANESEVFLVIGGPETVDGLLWWKLATPYDENRQGWAAADYLVAITNN
jgi:hypothetical protein